jgi:hypothetical protein
VKATVVMEETTIGMKPEVRHSIGKQRLLFDEAI